MTDTPEDVRAERDALRLRVAEAQAVAAKLAEALRIVVAHHVPLHEMGGNSVWPHHDRLRAQEALAAFKAGGTAALEARDRRDARIREAALWGAAAVAQAQCKSGNTGGCEKTRASGLRCTACRIEADLRALAKAGA